MKIIIKDNVEDLAKEAAGFAAAILCEGIREKGCAHFIAATGASQFEFLKELVNHKEIDWSRTIMFHLDEYDGISIDHPASLVGRQSQIQAHLLHQSEFWRPQTNFNI